MLPILYPYNLAAKSNRFPVIAYIMAGNIEKANIRYDLVTEINYCFLKPNADGSLQPLPKPETLKKIVHLAKKKNVSVRVAIGGWNNGDDSAFETLASSPKSRTRFITEVTQFAKIYNLAGIDMDWEYPNPGKSADNFYLLMKELSFALKQVNKHLSAAVVSYGRTGDAIKSEVFDYIDHLNIMTYDGPAHSSMKQAENGINYWLKRGISKEKLILGVPFYSRGKKVMTYRKILMEYPNAYKTDSMEGINYNCPKTISLKTNLAIKHAGGIMFWELSQDTKDKKKSLLEAINRTIKEKK